MKTYEILLIDDDSITNFINKKIIESVFSDCRMLIFENAREAIAYIRDNPHKPFVIFLDINMPVMNGWQFLEVISTDAKHNDMKINILTSSIDPSDIRKTQE